MSIKRLFTLLSISIVIILANQSSFASNESIINEHITTIISNSDSNGSISLVRKINDLQELESDMNKEIILGKEYIVDTYSDGSFLSFVAEDIPKSNLKSYMDILGSGPVYTQSRQFTYTYTNILGIKQTAYVVIIETTFVSDYEFGYIVRIAGNYIIYNSTYILYWSELPDTSTYHATGLDSYHNGTHGYSIFSSLYNTITGQLTISVSNY